MMTILNIIIVKCIVIDLLNKSFVSVLRLDVLHSQIHIYYENHDYIINMGAVPLNGTDFFPNVFVCESILILKRNAFGPRIPVLSKHGYLFDV